VEQWIHQIKIHIEMLLFVGGLCVVCWFDGDDLFALYFDCYFLQFGEGPLNV
jgi:hypothetical protein